jgi:hypothetical protein
MIRSWKSIKLYAEKATLREEHTSQLSRLALSTAFIPFLDTLVERLLVTMSGSLVIIEPRMRSFILLRLFVRRMR